MVGGGSFKPADIAYILFRHKWKILLFSLAGLIAAAAAWGRYKPTFVSTATLLIRYVLESRTAGPDSADQIRNPDRSGDSIISSEIEILMSLDLAEEVAKEVGATNILKKTEANPDLEAAVAIRKNLDVGIRPRSNVIGISFRHSDPKVARDVVTTLIAKYLKMHTRIHRALDQLDDLARQADQKRSVVEQTEIELRKIKSELGIVSVVDTQKAVGDLIGRLRSEIVEAEAELAEGQAAMARITNSIPATTALLATNQAVLPPVPQDVIKSHENLLLRLDTLRKREQELLLQFKPTSTYVTRVTEQIAESVAERDRLEKEHPGLALLPTVTPQATDRSTLSGKKLDPTVEQARIDSLLAKLQVLKAQLEDKKAEALRIAARESEITQLERKLQITEKQYAYFTTALEEARVNDAVSNNRLANISVVQSASPGARDTGSLMKILAGCVFGGVGLGLGLALAIEFYTDQSVRRPKQITENLHLPLFLSLPKLVPPPQSVVANGQQKSIGSGEDQGAPDAHDSTEGKMASYAEALRDRLIMHFQSKELHHKPKLIGVTSCGRGAGVTTIASNLASSLSETGEGNVLYVDVSQLNGPAVHPFHKGKSVVGVDHVLTAGLRENALVSENLYMVSLADPGGRKVGVLPKRIAALVQQIKTSDYDYIIFDLPPVSQTSATARVSGLLDTTILVLESEKTHADLAKQAVGLLAESHTEMVAVLNKHRRYLPRTLDSDL